MNTYLVTFIGGAQGRIQGKSFAHAYAKAMTVSHVVSMKLIVVVL